MKTVFYFPFLIVMIVSVFMSCSKDRLEEDEVTKNAYGSMNDFYNANKPPEQEFPITKDGTGPIIGMQGTKLWAGKNIFMHSDCTDVQYPFTVKLVELYTPSDMILYNMPTVAGGKLLVTGGEIRVRAFKGQEELLLKPHCSYMAHVPSDSPDVKMELFYGFTNGNYTDWTNNISLLDTTPWLDSLASIDDDTAGYIMSIPRMGWINVDYFYTYPGVKTTITFSSQTDDLTHVDKFLYFKDIRSVMQVYGNASGYTPVGEEVVIICMGRTDQGKMYYFTQTTAIVVNQQINVVMTEISEVDLITFLKGL